MLATKLSIKIPDFELERRVLIERLKNGIKISGLDLDGSSYSLFKSVIMTTKNNN